MEKRPVETLVERIDAALARIERALVRSRADMSALEGRHEQLKASVTDALGEIDSLITQAHE